MDLVALRTFLVVADERHFGRAAERLNLAQPAVSQQIKRLERDLGVSVLRRTSRSVELTEAGEHLRSRARSILQEVENARADVRSIRGGRAGRVAVGFVGTATYDVLPQVTRSIRRALPDIDLQVRGERLTPELLRMLRDRDVDLAVVRDPDRIEELDVSPLRREPLIAALPLDLALDRIGDGVRLADLRDQTFVTHPSGQRSAMFGAVLRACREAGFTPRDIIEVAETSTLVAFVAAGLGVGLVPESVRSVALDGVAYRRLSDVAPRTDLLLAARAGQSTPATRSVRDVILRQVRGHG